MADAIVAQNQIISRAEAKKLGLTRYYTGVPCKHGHISVRIVSHRRCAECHNAQYRDYAARKKDKVSALFKAWRQNNLQSERKRSINWKLENSEKVAAYNKIYAAENPLLMRTKGRNRRARKSNAEGSHTDKEISDLYQKQRGKCANPVCNCSIKRGYHADHIVALANGGSNLISNIQLLCPTCNMRKSTKDPIVWANENGMLL